MLTRIRSLWGIALGLVLAPSLGLTAEPELSADAPISADFNTNELIAAGNARFEHDEVVVEADEIRFNQNTRKITATGNVRVTRRGLRIVAEEVTYNIDTKAFSSGRFRAGTPPIFVEGESFSGNLNEFEMRNAQVYYLEPDRASPSIKLESATIRPGERVSGKGVSLGLPFLGGIPLPSFDREMDAPSIEFRGNAGYRGVLGVYVQSEMLLPVNDELKLGMNLDGYTRRGVLAGPALRFRRTLRDGGETKIDLSAGWISDQGKVDVRGVDVIEAPVDRHRYLGDLAIHHRTNDFELILQTSILSDSEVERDFRQERFNAQPHPDSFLEINQLVGDDFFLSVFVERNPNEFFRNVERLPELTFEMPLRPIGETALIHGAKLRYVRLRAWGENSPGDENDPARTLRSAPWPAAHELDLFASDRWDNLAEAVYSLRYPIRLGKAATFTPLAESNLILTREGERLDEEDAGTSRYNRGLTDDNGSVAAVGFDFEATLHGDFSLRSDSWDIFGLRHIIQPTVQFRFFEGEDLAGPEIFFPLFDTLRPDLDLLTRRDRSNLGKEAYFYRLGLKNTFLATGKDGTVRELATVGLFFDRATDELLDRFEPTNAYLEFSARPARWLELRLDQKFTSNWTLQEARVRAILRSAEAWELGLSIDYLDGLYDQYRAEGAYRISERAMLIGGWRYDARRSELTRQVYGVRYQLGSAWQIEAAIVFRQGAQREDDIGFEARVQLLRF